jgi:hypothetical protein
VFPNPFNPSTTIRIQVDRDPGAGSSMEMSIVDISGKSIRRLVQPVPGGQGVYSRVLTWDGHDLAGKSAASGVYFLIVKYHDRLMKQRMMLIK